MKITDRLTRLLALGGTVLVWFPVAAPLLFSLAILIRLRQFHFDYLMPAEFFPLALVGCILLVWAAARQRAYRRLITWSAAGAVGILILGQALAVVTGLSTGRIEPGGAAWTVVLASLVLYTLALAAAGVGGILLMREIRASSRQRS